MAEDPVRLAVIGGSGLYELAGLEQVQEVSLDTPYGSPSDVIRVGLLRGRRVAFLARHGAEHRLLPGEINYRANILGLKMLGVERIFSASAVGSMREEIRPRDIVLVDQFIDRTQGRQATFFGDGIAAHVSFADPICNALRSALATAGSRASATVVDRGTYVCMQGPAFSTRTESQLYRSWGVDVIGMTNLTEAKLAREAEICYATLALVTDYDCWHEEEADVSVTAVLDNLKANAATAAAILHDVLDGLPDERDRCGCADALQHALLTRPEAIPASARRRLAPILGRYLATGGDVPGPA